MTALLARWLLAVLAAALSGCLGGDPGHADPDRCSLSVTVEKDTGQAFFNLTQSVLDVNPPLANLFAKPGVRGGIGMPVSCTEGEAVLSDLQRRGAHVRHYEGWGSEVYVRHGGDPYELTLGYDVAD